MPTEEELRRQQAQDIAARTRGAQDRGWRAAMQRRGSPLDMFSRQGGAVSSTDPGYAIEGLQGNIGARMREQGEAASEPYRNRSRMEIEPAPAARPPARLEPSGIMRPVYPSQALVPPVRGSFDQGGTVQQTGDYEVHQGEQLLPPPERVGAPPASVSIQDVKKGGGDNPMLEKSQRDLSQMAGNVNAPLQRVPGFKRGGMIPRTGIYRLHQGEEVLKKSLAERYRKSKHG